MKPIRLRVSGKYACFTRPELKYERMTYDVITGSAARGVLESIYLHPGVFWRVNKIYIEKPIKYVSFMRNELKEKVSCGKIFDVTQGKMGLDELYTDRIDDIAQRVTTCLSDVQYVIEANFEIEPGSMSHDIYDDKVFAIFTQRAQKGKCFRQPYLGCKEFAANFKLLSNDEMPEPLDINRDLGIMHYEMAYMFDKYKNKEYTSVYKHVKIENGVVDYTKGDEFV